MAPETAPYGTWKSPIDAELVAESGIDFGHLALDGETIYWREQRPQEDGRGVIVRDEDGTPTDVVPEDVNVRTLVHEYGGGDFTVHDEVLYYAAFEDQRVYRQPVGSEPDLITPEPATEQGLRYADFEVTADGDALYCVREDHDAVEEDESIEQPQTSVVRIPTDRSEEPTVVASGTDFYAAPRLSPDGEQLAWLTWDHPNMPWDGTELHVADVADDGTLTNERVVMGGPDESVFQPAWSPAGTLHAVSDRTGWWNLYRYEDDEWVPYREEAAEYGVPMWVFGLATYTFLDDGRIATAVTRDGQRSLELLGADGSREIVDLPYAVYGGSFGAPRMRSTGEAVYFLGTGPRTPEELVRWEPDGGATVIARAADTGVDGMYLSEPEHVSIETRDGATTYAFYYPPTNPDVNPPTDEAPPLLVNVHGGPTSATNPAYRLSIQYFTSRGFAVADVNYRGSTGYGREYRETLSGDWGLTDVEDCLDVAEQLAADGKADPERLGVRGGSAGGFVVLSALAFHDTFTAGASYYGVADLGRLAELTHKFESRYLDQLVGPYPEDSETYDERSPVNHADGIDAPVLVLQGEDDPVVPLSQAEEMVEALEASDVPHELLVFEDELHGFRKADSRIRAYESELAFYGEVFGFTPADDLPTLSLE